MAKTSTLLKRGKPAEFIQYNFQLELLLQVLRRCRVGGANLGSEEEKPLQ